MERSPQHGNIGFLQLFQLCRQNIYVCQQHLVLPSALLKSLGNAEGCICSSRRLHIEGCFLASLFKGHVPVPCESGYALVLVYPLYSSLGSVVTPRRGGVIREKVDTSDGRLLACCLFNILEFRLIVHYVILGGRVGVDVVVVLAAVLLLTCDDMVSVGITEVAVQPFCRVGCILV